MTDTQALPDPMRDEFKAWITQHKNWINLAQYESGKFIHTPTEMMAEAWKVARATTAAPAGWQLVLIEPTREMMKAGAKHTTRDEDDEPYRARGQAICVWDEMLAASPKGPL